MKFKDTRGLQNTHVSCYAGIYVIDKVPSSERFRRARLPKPCHRGAEGQWKAPGDHTREKPAWLFPNDTAREALARPRAVPFHAIGSPGPGCWRRPWSRGLGRGMRRSHGTPTLALKIASVGVQRHGSGCERASHTATTFWRLERYLRNSLGLGRVLRVRDQRCKSRMFRRPGF